MEYKLSDFYIGQKVRVREWDEREWDEMVSMYGLNDWGSIRTPHDEFPRDWKQYCEQEGVITWIEGYDVKVDLDGPYVFDLFCTDIEPVEEIGTTNFFSEDSFMEMLGVAPT